MQRKKLIEFIIHIIFWIVTLRFFVNNSLLRFSFRDIHYEYVVLLMIICLIYFNLYFLIPKLFNKSRYLIYFLFIFLSTLCITIIEFYLIKPDLLFYTSNAQLDVQLASLRWYLFLIFFRDILFVGFFTMFQIYRNAIKANRLLKETAELKFQKYKVEINMLKSKINTHFLFNVLNMIYASSLTESKEIQDLILKLNNILKYIMIESEKGSVNIEKEIEFLYNYIELEKRRHKRINVEFNIDNNIPELKIAPMLFESFVNNAFKYVPKDESGFVKINIDYSTNGLLIFNCENNKVKNICEITSNKKGLHNTKERLEMLYNDSYELNIEDKDEIFTVNLLIKF